MFDPLSTRPSDRVTSPVAPIIACSATGSSDITPSDDPPNGAACQNFWAMDATRGKSGVDERLWMT